MFSTSHFYELEHMRSPWLAAVLSPILVGFVLYLLGSFFAVERVYLNYSPNESEGRPLLSWSLATGSGSAEKKFSDRLARDSGIERPLK